MAGTIVVAQSSSLAAVLIELIELLLSVRYIPSVNYIVLFQLRVGVWLQLQAVVLLVLLYCTYGNSRL